MTVELKEQTTPSRPFARRRNLDADLKALHDKHVKPLRAAAQRMFKSEDGRKILDALDRVFADEPLPKDGTGAVDPYAAIATVGARRVLDYLRNLAESEEGTGQ